MNREEKRRLEKNGVSKETIDKLNKYEKPCTVLEVVKLSRAVAEDVANEYLEDYRKRSSGTIIALTLQLEILKKLVIEKELISEEEFQSMYEESAKEFEEKQREYFNAMMKAESEMLQVNEETNDIKPSVTFDCNVGPVEVNPEFRD